MKDIFDAQTERDKIVLIQSALLLSSWYIDLEDRDGMTHWIGIAMSLAFTIGLHRKDDLPPIPSCPFPHSLRRLWKCLWWSIVSREIWTAFALGRPMRVHSEDCDVPLPSVIEVFGEDVASLPVEVSKFLPPDLIHLSEIWINFLELSLLLEKVLTRYYRPRCSPPSLPQIHSDENEILSCRSRLPGSGTGGFNCLSLHISYLKTCYKYDSYHCRLKIANCV